MGAIGNYIHLTYDGYTGHGLKFGPYHKGVGKVIANRERSFEN